jgi:hypothetical protein
MWNVCWQCGEYRVDKVIDPAGPYAVCPECGYHHPFRQLPLLVVSGASAAGKSTVCQALLGRITEALLLDSDILWMPVFNTPDDNYRAFFETWLRMCKNISQSGRPVVLFGSGFGVPANLDSCIERRYLGTLHIMALTCDSEILANRLRERPAWRGTGQPAFIEAQLKFNEWFKVNGSQDDSPITAMDTTNLTQSETSDIVARWIQAQLAMSDPQESLLS